MNLYLTVCTLLNIEAEFESTLPVVITNKRSGRITPGTYVYTQCEDHSADKYLGVRQPWRAGDRSLRLGPGDRP